MEYSNNPEAQLIDDHMLVGQLSDVDRATFVKKTYQHVALAVLLFVLLEYVFLRIDPLVNFALSLTQGWTWLLLLGGFAFATGYAEKWAKSSTNPQHQYWALLLYTAAEAFIFLPMIYICIAVLDAPGIFVQAGVLTLGLFGGLSAIVLFTGKDFSFLKSALMIGTFVAIAAIICAVLFGVDLGFWFSLAMIVLAGGSILYQTSNMVHHYRSDQHVAAALGLFGSLMLLFWYILDIMMRMSGD